MDADVIYDPVKPEPIFNPTRSTTRTRMVDPTRKFDPIRTFDPTQSTTRPVNARPGHTNPTACGTRCHALPHAPSLQVAREGAYEVNSRQSWYLQTRIEILYNVVYLFCVFEAFTYMKMRIEPYVRLEIRVFLCSSCISLWFRKYIW